MGGVEAARYAELISQNKAFVLAVAKVHYPDLYEEIKPDPPALVVEPAGEPMDVDVDTILRAATDVFKVSREKLLRERSTAPKRHLVYWVIRHLRPDLSSRQVVTLLQMGGDTRRLTYGLRKISANRKRYQPMLDMLIGRVKEIA